jgi:hypothetical protein
MKRIRLLATVTVLAVCQVSAETAYRSVDEQGNVTFSDRPVDGALQQEQIRIETTAPTVEQQRQTRQREAALEQAAGETGGTPRAAQRASEQKAARQAVEEAEKRLEEAARVREGDRIGTAGGGSRLKPGYHERVRAAEDTLEQARKDADSLR